MSPMAAAPFVSALSRRHSHLDATQMMSTPFWRRHHHPKTPPLPPHKAWLSGLFLYPTPKRIPTTHRSAVGRSTGVDHLPNAPLRRRRVTCTRRYDGLLASSWGGLNRSATTGVFRRRKRHQVVFVGWRVTPTRRPPGRF
uniref:Uncharacterized protein n=1 Tax=Opuntia streptacantha TaxID=393608 RepID=A0A7C9D673_OPUST